MSRTYEHFREEGEIDWYARGISDAEWQDATDAEPPTEPRFFTPVSIPVIPPVTKEGYNAFDHYTEKEWEELMQAPYYLRP